MARPCDAVDQIALAQRLHESADADRMQKGALGRGLKQFLARRRSFSFGLHSDLSKGMRHLPTTSGSVRVN